VGGGISKRNTFPWEGQTPVKPDSSVLLQCDNPLHRSSHAIKRALIKSQKAEKAEKAEKA